MKTKKNLGYRTAIFFLSLCSITACSWNGQEIKNEPLNIISDNTISQEVEQLEATSIQKGQTIEKKQMDKNGPTITFDLLSPEEITANNNSNGGNNMKEPLVFSENGIEVSVSNVFYVDLPYGKKSPNSSAPYSLTGTIPIIKFGNGPKYNLGKAMLGCIKPPETIKIMGTLKGKEVYTEKIEIDHSGLQEYQLDFDGIDGLIVYGGLGSPAIIDDIYLTEQ